jgi:hypothetical protein
MRMLGGSMPPGRTAAGGGVCGLVTAAAIGTVLASLGTYQVHDYADSDAPIGLAGSLVASILAVVLIAVVGRIGRRRLILRRTGGHALAALVMVPTAVAPLVLGGERNRLEAGLIWGAASVLLHVVQCGCDGHCSAPARGAPPLRDDPGWRSAQWSRAAMLASS